MGFQDRDYYRDDEPTWWARSARTRVTYALMLLLGVVFVAQVLGSNPARGRPDTILAVASFQADAITSGQVWRVLTTHLVHSRDALLLVGMTIWAVYFFGHRVETALGSPEFIAFLFSAALIGSLGQLAAVLLAGQPDAVTYGSGPVLTAMLVLFIVKFPHLETVVIITMPAWVLAGIVIAFELLGEFGGGFARSGLGAYLAAAAFALLYSRVPTPLTELFRLRPRATRPAPRATRLKLFRTPPDSTADLADDRTARDILDAFAPSSSPRAAAPALDEHLEAKLDEVLEKVSRSGRASLTGEEESILNRASEIYKQRKNS